MNDTVLKRRSTRHIKENKRLRKCTKITPWRDVWELESVGRALISVLEPDVSETEMPPEEAFETVALWKARSNAMEGLPHAVESTFHLAHVYWRDKLDPHSTISVTELRLSYSSTIVRAINGFADMLQQQRFVASSVSLLCAQLGIPAWIVDIRHEASHNVLPALSVLRLAASTLMNFLKKEYWVPTCPNWCEPKDDSSEEASAKAPATTTASTEGKKAIDYLLEYKACAVSYFSSSGDESLTNTSNQQTTISKRKTSKPVVTTLPIDPLFTDASSDDDDWEDPLLGRVWGSSVGTSSNRFALLEPPKSKQKPKTKTTEKKKKPSFKPTQKKKPGEKYPIDYAKDFVAAISPQDGFATAIMFLVWGGIGGSPPGRGALIPGSVNSFPSSTKGITKSWQRYAPLLQVLGRLWPGFCSSLLVHLVDFVLNIEENVVENKSLDAGSARKLLFLSSWIRFLLSQQFIATIDPDFVSKASNKKNGPTELALAELLYLEKLRYPLNALGDRCSEHIDNGDFRKTSHDVLGSIEEILGERRVKANGMQNVGVPEGEDEGTVVEGPFSLSPDQSPIQTTIDPTAEEQEVPITPSEQSGGGAKFSLDDMEALLLNGEDSGADKAHLEDEKRLKESNDFTDATPMHASGDHDVNGQVASTLSTDNVRSAWVRCSTWEPCSLGSLPGYPC